MTSVQLFQDIAMPGHPSIINNKLRLLTPGPTPLPEEVRLALARDMLHHRKDDFRVIMANVQEKLRTLFGCASPVLPLACTGTGAMTAAVFSLFRPGERVLVVETGKFGQRWKEIAKNRGLDVVILQFPWGEPVASDTIRQALTFNPDIRGILIQACETSTSALLPVKETAQIAKDFDCLTIVDGISAVGISPCPMDEWEIDCLLTGSQKGLMLPPGLGLIALSENAWKKAEDIEPGCYYFNLPAEKRNILKNQTNFTTPVNLLIGLSASLDLLLKDGLESVYRKQWAITQLVRTGAFALGLPPLVENNFSWGVTALKIPAALNATACLDYMKKEFGVIMAGGQDHLKDHIIRFGHMGWVDWSDCIGGLCALYEALRHYSFSIHNTSFTQTAMEAYMTALELPYSKK